MDLLDTLDNPIQPLESFFRGLWKQGFMKNWCFGILYIREISICFLKKSFASKPSKTLSRGWMWLSKVSRRSNYIKALQCTIFHGHTISQSFFIEADVSHWLFFKKIKAKLLPFMGYIHANKAFLQWRKRRKNKPTLFNFGCSSSKCSFLYCVQFMYIYCN